VQARLGRAQGNPHHMYFHARRQHHCCQIINLKFKGKNMTQALVEICRVSACTSTCKSYLRTDSKEMQTTAISLFYEIYKEAAKTISLLTQSEAASIFRYKDGSPIIRAALRTSLQSSSRRIIHRTMLPSGVSVNCLTSLKGTPRAH